jgi:hypothetical protein
MIRFNKVVTLTFWATLGLVVAGGLVRATGGRSWVSGLADLLGLLVATH